MVDKLRKEYRFQTFKEAIAFVNRVADLAEAQKHHPDIYINYKTVVIELWTHETNSVSEKDYTMASKIQDLVAS